MKTDPESRRLTVLSSLLAVTLCLALASACHQESTPAPPAAEPKPAAAPPVASAAEPRAELKAIVGRWARADGDYTIEISEVGPGGKLSAGYLNPRPIKVSKAEATLVGSIPKVFIELRDTGYDGCTYTLMHDQKSDQLTGIYYQATLQQNFDVVFARLK